MARYETAAIIAHVRRRVNRTAEVRRYRQPVYLRDSYPTLCELAGVPVPNGLDGRSFARVFRDPSAVTYAYVVGYFRDVQRMIRTERWKLIGYPKLDRRQLFDLQADPHERNDLAQDPAQRERLLRLVAALRTWQRDHGDPLAR